jgi:DNA-binding PucR family transcriptional regulator
VEEDLHRERIGHLLGLVADRIANPTALDATLHSAGLSDSQLVFSVWPAGAARVLSAAAMNEQIVLGETPEATIAVTSQMDLVLGMAERLGVVCGYSSSMGAAEAVRGLGEARAAFELARQGTRSLGPEALTSLEGLLRQQPLSRLQPFVDQLIAPLVDIDTRRNTELVKTLATYLETDGSLVATARAQFLHVNTVRHRLERIAQITGRDPQVFSDRTALAIAFWASTN